jgi:hypothetical protein
VFSSCCTTSIPSRIGFGDEGRVLPLTLGSIDVVTHVGQENGLLWFVSWSATSHSDVAASIHPLRHSQCHIPRYSRMPFRTVLHQDIRESTCSVKLGQDLEYWTSLLSTSRTARQYLLRTLHACPRTFIVFLKIDRRAKGPCGMSHRCGTNASSSRIIVKRRHGNRHR